LKTYTRPLPRKFDSKKKTKKKEKNKKPSDKREKEEKKGMGGVEKPMWARKGKKEEGGEGRGRTFALTLTPIFLAINFPKKGKGL